MFTFITYHLRDPDKDKDELGRPVHAFQDKNQFYKAKHRRFLVLTNPVSPFESGLEGLLFCCAVTITCKCSESLD